MYLKNNNTIKEIVDILKENDIEITSLMYSKNVEYLRERIDVCKQHNLKLNNELFRVNINDLQENIDYIRENYSKDYITSATVTKNPKRVKEVFNYMESKELLRYLPNADFIFTLDIKKLKERVDYLIDNNLDIVEQNEFNNILTMTTRKFNSLKNKKVSQLV